MTSRSHKRVPTLYEVIEALPAGSNGEIVDGQLHVTPRPSARHGLASSNLGADLVNPYSRGRGGPGGWWIIGEPEVHFIRDTELCVPDLGGWRRERMPTLPDEHRFEIAPDWVCEVLSPSTASYDREVKMPLYARRGVRHAWLVDPKSRTLEAYELDGDRWREIARFDRDDPIRVAPFEDIEVSSPWE